MDHLPLPSKPSIPPIEVPYRCTEAYDGGEFFSYPERHGWEVLYHTGGISYLLNGEEPSIAALDAFLQTWLYFGMIHEAFGDFWEFVVDNKEGERIISTTNLNDACVYWNARIKGFLQAGYKEDVVQPEFERIHKVSFHTWKVISNTGKSIRASLDHGILFSIAVLAETIQKLLVPFDLSYANATWRRYGNPPIGEIILESMLETGWCKFDVWRIDCTSSVASLLYYLGNLPPPRPQANHAECTNDHCTAMTIDLSYKTMHTAAGCSCADFSDINAVLSALDGEELPLIRYIDAVETPAGTNTRASFEIIESNGDMEFVAISHVWAEGMGNPHGNALPECSLKMVSDMIDQTFPTGDKTRLPFWLDTICVPTKPENMRIRAMNRLRKPYQEAKHVLVLDSYLYNHKAADLPALEIWARVLCCSWSRRLWTFQEARLAKDLWYQFADRAVSMEEIFLSMMNEGPAASPLVDNLVLAYRAGNPTQARKGQIGRLYQSLYQPEPTLRDMRESLQARAVSVASDEALCLFCNMNMDMEIVTSLAPEDRMSRFWADMKKVPLGLVFSTSAKKLATPGLRWAPSSFMGELDSQHWYLEQSIEPRRDGFATPQGLQIQAPGLMCDSRLLTYDDSFDTLFADTWLSLSDEDGTWYFIETLGLWHQERTEEPLAKECVVTLLVTPVEEFDKMYVDGSLDFALGTEAVIGVASPSTNGEGIPHFKAYKHGRLHRYPETYQRYHSAVAACVEAFVEGECAQQAKAKRKNRSATEAVELETPDTYQLTVKRREDCQAYAAWYAGRHPTAKAIVEELARAKREPISETTENFAMDARFRLQMRLRNTVRKIPQTQRWIID